ncbi:MAG: pseudouridylate synthase [Bacteroidales bacterium]|nr:pseudouridylate synthase [Bacteroidales bacterium]
MTSFADIDILGILPQREPFLFVDRLLHYDDRETRTAFTVPEGHLLVEDGLLSASGVLENMAQSSAARIGYLNKYILHVPVRVGYIGAIRKFRVNRLPAVGETLETSVFLREDVFGISLADAVVRVGEEVIAEASLKTALGEKEAE